MLGPFCLFLLQLLSLVLQSHLDRDIWGRGERKEDGGGELRGSDGAWNTALF